LVFCALERKCFDENASFKFLNVIHSTNPFKKPVVFNSKPLLRKATSAW
jgi:hypothetical protein